MSSDDHSSDDHSSDDVPAASAVAPPPTLSSRRLPTSYQTGRSYHLLSLALNLLPFVMGIVMGVSGGVAIFFFGVSVIVYYAEALWIGVLDDPRAGSTLRFIRNTVTPRVVLYLSQHAKHASHAF